MSDIGLTVGKTSKTTIADARTQLKIPRIQTENVAAETGNFAYNTPDGQLYYGRDNEWIPLTNASPSCPIDFAVALTGEVSVQDDTEESVDTFGSELFTPQTAFTWNAGVGTCIQPGLYEVNVTLSYNVEVASFSYIYVKIRKNGSVVFSKPNSFGDTTQEDYRNLEASGLLSLEAGDTISASIRTYAGANGDIMTEASQFWGKKVDP